MALVSGVNIPDHKRVEIALRAVFGIGEARAKQVISEANIEDNPRVRDLAEDQLSRMREIIDRTFKVEGDLRREVQTNAPEPTLVPVRDPRRRLQDVGGLPSRNLI